MVISQKYSGNCVAFLCPFTLYRLLNSLTNFSNNLVIANTTSVTFTQRTFALRVNDINTTTFQGETFSVNLGSVEEATGISSGIREEAIEINPGNTTYQNRTVSVQVLRSVFQELGRTDGQQRLSYAVFFEGHTLSVFR